ncbi:MAG: FimV/HubP family polar landmark protein [Aquabacterium sp.]|uniref:FimV/HubP family polar landmark protein n=1 Tax=Aquabacterium sp. TaxID=1872578 RepID=UPI003BB1C781
MKKVALAAAFSALSLAPLASWALGLGRLNVQSALGEPLRAEIEITSITNEEAASLQARVASAETYRAAGVDYNAVLAATTITLQKRADGRSVLRLSSDRTVSEPFVDAILDLAWSSGRLVREYTLLFDPATPRAAAPQPLTAPVMDAPAAPAPVPAPARAASPVPAPAPAVVAEPATRPAPAPRPTRPSASAAFAPASAPVRAQAPAPRPAAPVPAPAPVEAAAPTPRDSDAQSVKVRSGDTLSKIAEKNLPAGVSLDQMIVGLYRGNPHAFQGNNMNRLKSGVVLNVPDADKATSISQPEARQIITAQSSDFAAYRQRLAAGVTESVASTRERQASGKIEAEVQDRKQAATPAPDKLTLSKGGATAGQAAEDRLAKARAEKDANTRVAELSRNLDELRKLKEQSNQPKPAAAPAPAPKPAPVPAPKPAPVPAPAPAPVPVPAPAPAPAPVAAPAFVPSPAASVPASAPVAAEPASDVASGSATQVADAASQAASVAEPASVAAPTLPKPVQIPVPEAEPSSLSLFESIDPLLLAGAGAGIALIAGLGLYARSRRKSDSAETSFLESRLQPDSFFGASGGQRVDTRDATGGPSSMSYSLSQLDAIGDVDPVAEADVYLAYGRDLQAEEILKEALRSNPDRLAIRTKLLEVYAKRRDTKGFEQLAGQLFTLTGGVGDDWLHAQEMGLSIDPENPLYQPGGQPSAQMPQEPVYQEPLGASTVPLSEMPPLHEPAPASQAPQQVYTKDDDDLGIDLDISAPVPLSDEPPSLDDVPPLTGAYQAQPSVAPPAPAADDLSLDFDLPLDAGTPAAPAPAPVQAAAPSPAPTAPMDFDLSGISLDLGEPAPADAAAGGSVVEDLADNPLARKLELAEEFRHIGDVDGARELLQEVVAQADGALRAKAQAMLDSLG